MDKLKNKLMRCVAYCTANAYDLPALANIKRKGFISRLSKDVLHLSSVDTPVDLFFFSHGTFVSWGLQRKQELVWLEKLKSYSIGSLLLKETDHFGFRFGEEISIDTHDRLKLDMITLDADNPQVKLAISYCLGQSVKLESYEESIKETIQKNANLPEEIAMRGTISLSKNAILRRIGEIFIARSSINLNSEYLDMPEFFWRNPNVETYYIMTQKFLDLPSRVAALNQKLDVLQELLAILNSQVQHRHSTMLEVTIIVLILIEIAISLLHF